MTTQHPTGEIRLTIPALLNKTRIRFGLPRPFKPHVLFYRTEQGNIDVINRFDGFGVTDEQRAFMLDQITQHGGLVGGAL